MSSKTKKKLTAAGTPTAAAPEKKFRLPKALIARPHQNGALKVVFNAELASALDLQKGAFAVVGKDAAAGSVVALVDISENIEPAEVLLLKPLRTLAGILLGDRLSVAKHKGQMVYSAKTYVHVMENDAGTDAGEIAPLVVKKTLLDAGVVHLGMVLPCEGRTMQITGVEAQETASLVSVAAGLGQLSLSSSLEPLFVSPPHLFIPNSEVEVVQQPFDAAKYPRVPRPVRFDQVGGLEKAIALLRSTVELPLHHASLFLDFGIAPPRGILLHGPPGTGKTMLLRCVAHECDAHVLTVNGPLIVSKYLGETEQVLRDMFAEASKYQPLVLFMDEIDSLAPKRGADDAMEADSRVVATLLTMMDGMGESGRVVVVGATNRPNSIDPALRRPGRFDQEVEVGIPDASARRDILAKQFGRMNAAKYALSDADIQVVALKTHGYVGADLSALCREAVMKTIARGLSGGVAGASVAALASSGLAQLDASFKVELRDLEDALVDVRPSAMREIFLEMPRVSWDDIAGQHDLKQKLVEVVQLPLEAAPAFAHLGISAPKGVLLYGPPGCSKTLTAKALASESGLNFLAVKGPEILNKYVGESERTIREIFRKARAAAPSIIFFDEIDAIASSRDDALTLASQNVLTSLLNEIDGVEVLKGVVVVAATNRPSELDAALLRPGRLDRHIYLAPPDRDARESIIRKKCARFGVENASALYSYLADATEGCSGAEVALLCQEAGLAAIKDIKDAPTVSWAHFEHALASISRGITPEMLAYYEDFAHRSGLSM
ncbi:AAA-domain-containing protein [Metschnikowia bicuspidata]|uniref:AAA-domain-containing protein n=1 Tax=Metschnikowia bicuspidata TaxID=27322 RepID=A0A4P9ZHR8_9ASCO|nr:AAA-domain-containing protein [Metschnikowia bicuspidata]